MPRETANQRRPGLPPRAARPSSRLVTGEHDRQGLQDRGAPDFHFPRLGLVVLQVAEGEFIRAGLETQHVVGDAALLAVDVHGPVGRKTHNDEFHPASGTSMPLAGSFLPVRYAVKGITFPTEPLSVVAVLAHRLSRATSHDQALFTL